MTAFESFLDAGGIVEVDDDMPDAYREAVSVFIEVHANSELARGLAERPWVSKTPGVRMKMAALAKTQDMIGHGHLLYMVAADLRIRTRDQMVEGFFAEGGHAQSVFLPEAKRWGDHVTKAFLMDAAALARQQAVFANCSYGPYRRILKRLISEKQIHTRLGEVRMERIAQGTETQQQIVQDALNRWWRPTLQLFEADAQDVDRLLRWRIVSESSDGVRDRWVQELVPILQSHGFTIPDPELAQALEHPGSDTSRAMAEASANWANTRWVREAMV